MNSSRILATIGVLALLLAACGPAAGAIPTPTTPPEATPTTPSMALTATPKPPGVTPTMAPTPRPTVAPSKPSEATPRQGGILRVPLRLDIPKWDPHLEQGGALELRIVSDLVFAKTITRQWPEKEGTCKLGTIPDLAESWKWVNDTTLLINVRRGVRFQPKLPVNGREVVADDLVFSLRRLGTVPAVQSVYAKIEDITASDRYTIQIKLKSPYSGLITDYLAYYRGSVVLPPESGAGPGKDWSDPYKSWIGAGPFRFEGYRPGVSVSLTRNADYWKKPLPYVEGVRFSMVPDESTRIAGLISGVFDMVTEIEPLSSFTVGKVAPKMEIVGCPRPAGSVNLYVRTDKPPFNDLRVRRALSMAVDRQGIVDATFLGSGEPVLILMSSFEEAMSLQDFPGDVRRYLEYHPDEAKRLLAEAGYPKGVEVELTTTTKDGIIITHFSEALAAMLAKAGFNVKLNWLEAGRYNATYQSGNWNDMLYGRPSQVELLQWVYQRLYSKSPASDNRSRIADPELDKMIDAVTVTVDEEKRLKLWRDIQIYLADQAYWFQLANYMESSARQPTVKSRYGYGMAQYVRSMIESVWLE